MAFLVLQLKDLFLDSILAYQTEDKNIVPLTDAMGTTHGLVFDSRIPPIIKKDDTIGGSEVETYTTSFQADEEDGDVGIVLELGNGCGAVAGVTIKGDEADSTLTEELLHLVERTDKLREDQNLTMLGTEQIDIVESCLEFRGRSSDGIATYRTGEKRRGDAGLPEAEKAFEGNAADATR